MSSGPEYAATDADIRVLILAWYRRARQAQLAHARAASRARRNKIFLGLPTVVLGAVVGSAIFASINAAPGKGWQIAAGLLSLVSAVLAALQTFLRLDEQIADHENASRQFGKIRRELGELGALGQRPRTEALSCIDKLRQSYDHASESTRNVPNRIWENFTGGSTFWPAEFACWPEYPSPDGARVPQNMPG